jgi:tetratricopeptide (TPR) repeat protein
LRVSAIGRDDALALCWAGFSLVRVCRDDDTGAALVDQALSVNQNLAIGWQMRGWVSLSLGQHEAAIEQLTYALRLSPLDPESFQSESAMGFAHLFQGRYAEALAWTSRSHAHHPNWPVAMRTAAAANALAGNIDEARKIAAQLRLMDPEMRIFHLKEFFPYRRAEDIERMIKGLRLAGLPE